MKYIVYILFIACLATLSFFYSFGLDSDENDYAVRIDGRSLSVAEIDKVKQQSPDQFSHTDEPPDVLIMREVLITEALRQNIDQEQAFRHRLKTFYEQSLVKILVERKLDSIRYVPTNEEIMAYANLLGRTIDIDLIPLDSSSQPLLDNTEHLSGPFLDFNEVIRMEILFQEIGTRSKKVDLFGQIYFFVVTQISEKDPGFSNYNEERDLAVIHEFRKQEQFGQWQEFLLKQAEVVVAPKQGEQRQ